MSVKPAERPIGSVNPVLIRDFLVQSLAIAEVEIRKLIRDPTELLTRAVQPILWLVVFGQIFSRVRGIPTGNVSYQTFMAPGILSQSVLFSAIFYGIAVIWERDLGIVHKLLVSPAYRSALVFGKSMAAGLRGIFQAVVIYLLAFFMNIGVAVNAGAIILVIAAVIIGSAIFSTFSLIIACLVKTRERFMGIGQLLTMPLFFASNAIYPLELMPNWLKVLAGFNPLTYLVDALRGTMIAGGESVFGLVLDFSVLWIVYLFLLVIAALLYPVLVE